MSSARQALALSLLGLVAGSVGFAGASALEDPKPAPQPSAYSTPTQEALLAEPEAPRLTASPTRAPDTRAPGVPIAPRLTPAAPEHRSAARPRRSTTAPTRAVPSTTAGRPAVPGVPTPVPPQRPAPATTAPPASRPPASVHEEPPDPPTGIAILATTAITGSDAAHRILVDALTNAAPESVERSDLTRALALWRTYLGPGAESVPAGRRETIARALRANAWWFRDQNSPRERVLLRDEDGVILTYRAGQGFVVNPVATIGRWRGLNDDVPSAALAESFLQMGVERIAEGRRFLVWEYYDAGGDPTAIVPGASAMAQARVALLMAHARATTGDRRFARGALDALGAFTVDVDAGGVRSMVGVLPLQPLAPWYVERAYPGENPWKGGALNGFMVALLNLRDAAAILESTPDGDGDRAAAIDRARDLSDDGAQTLARHLGDHDSGAWSYYGLLTPGRPWRTYLADLNYHCYHIRLLDQLATSYPELGFAITSDRWQGYVDAAGATCPDR